jgi:hypothetical protein
MIYSKHPPSDEKHLQHTLSTFLGLRPISDLLIGAGWQPYKGNLFQERKKIVNTSLASY